MQRQRATGFHPPYLSKIGLQLIRRVFEVGGLELTEVCSRHELLLQQQSAHRDVVSVLGRAEVELLFVIILRHEDEATVPSRQPDIDRRIALLRSLVVFCAESYCNGRGAWAEQEGKNPSDW